MADQQQRRRQQRDRVLAAVERGSTVYWSTSDGDVHVLAPDPSDRDRFVLRSLSDVLAGAERVYRLERSRLASYLQNYAPGFRNFGGHGSVVDIEEPPGRSVRGRLAQRFVEGEKLAEVYRGATMVLRLRSDDHNRQRVFALRALPDSIEVLSLEDVERHGRIRPVAGSVRFWATDDGIRVDLWGDRFGDRAIGLDGVIDAFAGTSRDLATTPADWDLLGDAQRRLDAALGSPLARVQAALASGERIDATTAGGKQIVLRPSGAEATVSIKPAGIRGRFSRDVEVLGVEGVTAEGTTVVLHGRDGRRVGLEGESIRTAARPDRARWQLAFGRERTAELAESR